MMTLNAVARLAAIAALCLAGQMVRAGAPPWLHALTQASLPAHDERTPAVVLYSEITMTVQPNGQIRRHKREALRILRGDGGGRDVLRVDYGDQSRTTDMHGWSIPAQGNDYEVKMSEAVESAYIGVDDSTLVSDVRSQLLKIPAGVPGSVLGYEFEQRIQPYILTDDWDIQQTVPVREARYTLQLPPGWSYRAVWVNHDEVAPTAAGTGRWQWVVTDQRAIRREPYMPPWRAVGGRMFVALVPPNARNGAFESWAAVGQWFEDLTKGRDAITPALHQKVTELTNNVADPLEKVQAIARFVQSDIRYVGIELGIGGYQPHPASDVFAHRYGDCKDKVLLFNAMLKDAGLESYFVLIDTQRGAVQKSSPPDIAFNHAIAAIILPKQVQDASLQAVVDHPALGRLVYFDPTDEVTPLGRLSSPLQGSYGLLVGPGISELLETPKLEAAAAGTHRMGRFVLDSQGNLSGEVEESRDGAAAYYQRLLLRGLAQDSDRIKPIENLLASSFPAFRVDRASISNKASPEKPLGWHYAISVDQYAKPSGDSLLVRARVLGSKVDGFLETREPRENAIVFQEALRDSDEFEVQYPETLEVESLPPSTNVDLGYAAYHSKTSVSGHTLKYERQFEFRELAIPAGKAEELKQFYRSITNDERQLAVLRPRR